MKKYIIGFSILASAASTSSSWGACNTWDQLVQVEPGYLSIFAQRDKDGNLAQFGSRTLGERPGWLVTPGNPTAPTKNSLLGLVNSFILSSWYCIPQAPNSRFPNIKFPELSGTGISSSSYQNSLFLQNATYGKLIRTGNQLLAINPTLVGVQLLNGKGILEFSVFEPSYTRGNGGLVTGATYSDYGIFNIEFDPGPDQYLFKIFQDLIKATTLSNYGAPTTISAQITFTANMSDAVISNYDDEPLYGAFPLKRKMVQGVDGNPISGRLISAIVYPGINQGGTFGSATGNDIALVENDINGYDVPTGGQNIRIELYGTPYTSVSGNGKFGVSVLPSNQFAIAPMPDTDPSAPAFVITGKVQDQAGVQYMQMNLGSFVIPIGFRILAPKPVPGPRTPARK